MSSARYPFRVVTRNCGPSVDKLSQDDSPWRCGGCKALFTGEDKLVHRATLRYWLTGKSYDPSNDGHFCVDFGPCPICKKHVRYADHGPCEPRRPVHVLDRNNLLSNSDLLEVLREQRQAIVEQRQAIRDLNQRLDELEAQK